MHSSSKSDTSSKPFVLLRVTTHLLSSIAFVHSVSNMLSVVAIKLLFGWNKHEHVLKRGLVIINTIHISLVSTKLNASVNYSPLNSCYIHLVAVELVGLFNGSLMQISNHPNMSQQFKAFRHVDMVKSSCWNSNWASGRRINGSCLVIGARQAGLGISDISHTAISRIDKEWSGKEKIPSRQQSLKQMCYNSRRPHLMRLMWDNRKLRLHLTWKVGR